MDLTATTTLHSYRRLSSATLSRRRSSLASVIATTKDEMLLHTWDTFKSFLFPFIPSGPESYISMQFWHSILVTGTTPLHRYLTGKWAGIATMSWLLEACTPTWISSKVLSYGSSIPYETTGKQIDRAFGLHALFSLLWLVLAYIQIVHTKKIHNVTVHKYLGYVTTIAFLGHSFCALHNIYADIVHHTSLVKLMFISAIFSHFSQFVRAIAYVIKKSEYTNWYTKHQDEMVLLFLSSMVGAGPIRIVSEIQYFMGIGCAICQIQHGGYANNCQLEYVNRMILVGLWCLYMRGVYVASRNSKTLTLSFIKKDAIPIVLLAVILLAFCTYVPQANDIIMTVMGEPRSFQGNAITIIGAMILFSMEAKALIAFFKSGGDCGHFSSRYAVSHAKEIDTIKPNNLKANGSRLSLKVTLTSSRRRSSIVAAAGQMKKLM